MSILKPIVSAWCECIKKAEQDAAPWINVVDQCRAFYFSFSPIMDSDEKISRLFGKVGAETKPRFIVNLAKAFEAVAIFGPSLFWNIPERQAKPKPLFQIPSEIIGESPSPELQAVLQAAEVEHARLMPIRRLRAYLMERLLNYWPQVSDLARHVRAAITDAILTGRGVLLPQVEFQPQTGTFYIGSYHVPSVDLLVDSDATSLDDAYWIAIRVTEPKWAVAQRWGFDKSLLDGAKTVKSRVGRTGLYEDTKDQGRTQDYITYYRIWSRLGIGDRMQKVSDSLREVFSGIQDYCYLEIADGVDFPLNIPVPVLSQIDQQTISQMAAWPNPGYRPGAWPVAILDFYSLPGYCYPIPPIAPGLGELKTLQIFTGHLITKIWKATRDYIGVPADAHEQVVNAIKDQSDKDEVVIPIEVHQRAITDLVQFLKRPEVGAEYWQIINSLFQLFERRTGLTDLLYGVQPNTQSRSATDVQVRQTFSSIRPDYMASLVEEWQVNLARIEASLTRTAMRAEHIQPIFGSAASFLWRTIVESHPPTAVLEEIDYSISAMSSRRPSRQVDLENLLQFQQIYAPIFNQLAAATGDYQPLNTLISRWSQLTGFDPSGLLIRVPSPPAAGSQVMSSGQPNSANPVAEPPEQNTQEAQGMNYTG